MSTRSRVVARTGLATPTEPATAAEEVEEVEEAVRGPPLSEALPSGQRPSTFHHHRTCLHRLHHHLLRRLRHLRYMQARCGPR